MHISGTTLSMLPLVLRGSRHSPNAYNESTVLTPWQRPGNNANGGHAMQLNNI